MTISDAITKIINDMQIGFILNDKPISGKEALSDKGLLPALARRADQMLTLCVGYGIGISFDEADNSILGVRVIFDNVTPESLRLLCILDVIMDIVDYSEDKEKVPLDELLYD
ncbi:MAG: type IV secretion protein IcmS [Legionellales bacterium]|nr:type IV secretion protein IcmS [Legionellales bacterium]